MTHRLWPTLTIGMVLMMMMIGVAASTSPPSPSSTTPIKTESKAFAIELWAGNGRKRTDDGRSDDLGALSSPALTASFEMPSHLTWNPTKRLLYVMEPHHIRVITVNDTHAGMLPLS
jgi:hypothetical protein